ncbi:MAG: hypothetical protein WA865_16575, partial [Spirulinaceae cyanobacterium]
WRPVGVSIPNRDYYTLQRRQGIQFSSLFLVSIPNRDYYTLQPPHLETIDIFSFQSTFARNSSKSIITTSKEQHQNAETLAV